MNKKKDKDQLKTEEKKIETNGLPKRNTNKNKNDNIAVEINLCLNS